MNYPNFDMTEAKRTRRKAVQSNLRFYLAMLRNHPDRCPNGLASRMLATESAPAPIETPAISPERQRRAVLAEREARRRARLRAESKPVTAPAPAAKSAPGRREIAARRREQVAALIADGRHCQAIMAEIGISNTRVYSIAAELGLKVPRKPTSQRLRIGRPPDISQRARVAELLKSGRSVAEIASETGRCYASVNQMLQRMGVVPAKRRFCGDLPGGGSFKLAILGKNGPAQINALMTQITRAFQTQGV